MRKKVENLANKGCSWREKNAIKKELLFQRVEKEEERTTSSPYSLSTMIRNHRE
jgi:hypothetical protein